MRPHTFEAMGLGSWKCLACGRVERAPESDQAPATCPGCLAIENMDTVQAPPFSAADLEPPPASP